METIPREISYVFGIAVQLSNKITELRETADRYKKSNRNNEEILKCEGTLEEWSSATKSLNEGRLRLTRVNRELSQLHESSADLKKKIDALSAQGLWGQA